MLLMIIIELFMMVSLWLLTYQTFAILFNILNPEVFNLPIVGAGIEVLLAPYTNFIILSGAVLGFTALYMSNSFMQTLKSRSKAQYLETPPIKEA